MTLELLDAAASAMDAQRAALDVAARNVAAAEAAGPNGRYGRLVAQFRLAPDEDGETTVSFAGTHVARATNVDMLGEMLAVLDASRAYESDAALFETGKTLAEKTIALEQV